MPPANAEELSRATPVVCEDRTNERPQDFTHEPRIPGAAISERIRKGEDPLPDRDLGQDPLDEMGRRVGHATPATGRTEATALAGEGDEAIMAAGVAVDAEESMSAHAALEIGADLALDEAGDRGAGGASPCNERHELSANHFVEECLLGLATDGVGDGRRSAGTGVPSASR